MPLPTQFATLTGGNQPLTLFDNQFAAVAAMGSVPCAATGQNSIALVPFTNTPTVTAYPDLSPSFVFVAAQTSNGPVTINVNLVGARQAFKWNGAQLVGSGDIIAGEIYRAIPLLALNGGNGGFVVDTIGNASLNANLNFIIDGGGSAITTGQKGQINLPYPATITAWGVMADQAGSIVVDILRGVDVVPVSSIVGGGNKPTLAASQYTEAAVSGWTSTALNANDWIAFSVLSATTVTRATVSLRVTRT